jgi:hypothetical protein
MFLNYLRYAAAASAVAIVATAAQAAPINVAGVVFDPDNPMTFQMNSGNLRETSISMVGDTLSGYGLLSAINGTSEAQYCPGCEVTFVFSYTVAALNGNIVEFGNGSSQFYVDTTPDYDVLNPSTADNDGTLWLDLAGHTISAFGTTGDLVGMLTSGSFGGVLTGFGSGAFDVVGGAAQPYLDTDTLNDNLGGTTDLTFTSSFQSTGNPPASHPIFGSFDMQGDAQAIPEPATLGLFGLGLIGIGAIARRKQRHS